VRKSGSKFSPLSRKRKRYQSAKHTLKALKDENRILRSEIKRLQRLTKTLSSTNRSPSESDSETQKRWNDVKKESRLLSGGSYMKYTVSKITGGSVFSLWKQVSGYFRKFRLISTVMRVVSSLLTILGTGAFFIFVSGALVFIIPFFIIFSASLYVFGTVSRSKAFKELKARLEGKSVYVFFPQKGRPFEGGSCFKRTVGMISDENDSFTVIVSPYIFSSVGSRHGYYTVLSFEAQNVCIIRKHSFFSLRKKLLEPAEKQTVYIH